MTPRLGSPDASETENDVPPRHVLTRGAKLAFFVLLFFLILFGTYAQATRGLEASDDNLWLSYAVDKLLDRSAGSGFENEILDVLRKAGATEEATYRIAMRRDYDTNYRLAIATWAVFDRLLLSGTPDYKTRVTLRSTMALIPVVLLPWLAFSWLLWRSAPQCLRIASLAVLSWFALVSVIGVKSGHFIPFGQPLSLKTLSGLFLFSINPGAGFSIFGFTPRNMLSVLVACALIARWIGRVRLGYVFLALAVGVHTSLGLMVLSVILAGDIVIARQRLRDPVTIGIVALAVAYIAINERILAIAAPGTGLVLAAAAAGTLPLLVWWVRSDDPGAGVALLRRPIGLITRYVTSKPEPNVRQDVFVLLLAILVCLVTSATVSQFAPRLSVWYFWGQLPTRLYAAVGPSMIIGMVALTIRSRPTVPFLVPVYALAMVAIVGCVLKAARQVPPTKVIADGIERIETSLAKPSAGHIDDERLIYYELGRAMLLGGDPIARLRWPKPE